MMAKRSTMSGQLAGGEPAAQLDHVIENGLRFIEKAVLELWQKDASDHLKYSVINFYSGVELLIKARLFMEHWALIVSDTSKANADKFVRGDFRSIDLREAISRLKNIARQDVPVAAVSVFDQLRKHRNQMVHFYHKSDLRTKEGKALKAQIVREQCLGWHFLRLLLEETWEDEFEQVQARLAKINTAMKGHDAFFATVFGQVKEKIAIAKNEGAEVEQCFACGYAAIVIEALELGPGESRCLVCNRHHTFVMHKCENCNADVPLDQYEGDDWVCSRCDAPITLDDVLFAQTEEGELPDKEFHTEGGFATCHYCECYPPSVGTIGGGPFCFACHEWHLSYGTCGYCGGLSTGDLDDSYLTGCVNCEGKFHGD